MTEFRLTPPRTRTVRRHDEDDLQELVVKFLNLALPRDVIFFHPANGGFRLKKEAARLKRMGQLVGVADLVFVHQGRTLFLEMKTADGVMAQPQREFQRRCKELGIPYAVARSLDDVERVLRRWGVPLTGRVAA